LGELFKELIEAKAKYGIATVQPNRAIKRCKTRNLRIEYFLAKIAVVLCVPKACSHCPQQGRCADDFVEQIVQKYLDHHPTVEDDSF
jgi:hypothetical protein